MSAQPAGRGRAPLRRSRVVRVPDGPGLEDPGDGAWLSRRHDGPQGDPALVASRAQRERRHRHRARPGRMSSTSTRRATAAATRHGTRLRQAGLAGEPQAVIRTPSGGMHAYYRGTQQRNGSLPEHAIDFRSTGGYVVTAPSTVSGRPYAVVSKQPSAATFRLERGPGAPRAAAPAGSRGGSPSATQGAPGTSATWPPGSLPSRRATATRPCSGPPTARVEAGDTATLAASPARPGQPGSTTARSTAPSGPLRRRPARPALLSIPARPAASRPPRGRTPHPGPRRSAARRSGRPQTRPASSSALEAAQSHGSTTGRAALSRPPGPRSSAPPRRLSQPSQHTSNPK